MRSQILSQILRRRILLAGCVALLLCVLRLALAAKPDAGITAIQQQALAEELAYQRAHDVTGLDEELLAPDDDADNPGSASAAPLRAADWYQDDDDAAEIPPERQLPSDFMW